jgi:hypothetical protein
LSLGLAQFVGARLLPYFRKAWTRDVDARVKDLRRQLDEMKTELGELRRAHRRVALAEWHARRTTVLASLDTRLKPEPARAHVAAAVRNATVCSEPTAHAVIADVLPADLYDLLAETIPPPELFPDRDPVKTDFEMEVLDSAPEITRRAWRFFDEEVVGGMLAPVLLERFRDAIVDHYAETGGRAFGEAAAMLPHRTVAGRIQLRRPGYHLRPHLDPKRVAITGLLYFPQPGDGDAYGTQLFSVDRPFVASGMKTFFPEDAGIQCTLARTIPYRANTMLVFVNSRAAHGASLPPDAPLHERYAFQFYIKPDDGQLKALLAGLPDTDRAAWEGLR